MGQTKSVEASSVKPEDMEKHQKEMEAHHKKMQQALGTGGFEIIKEILAKHENEGSEKGRKGIQDRSDLSSEWPLSFEDFLTPKLDDTRKIVNLGLSEEKLFKFESESDFFQAKAKGDHVLKIAVPHDAAVNVRKIDGPHILLRLRTPEVPELGNIISRCHGAAEVSKTILDLAGANVTKFEAKIVCEHLVLNFDKNLVVEAQQGMEDDDIQDAWVVIALAFGTSIWVNIEPQPDPLDHYFKMVKVTGKKQVLHSMRAEHVKESEIQRFELFCNAAGGALSPDYMKVLAAGAPTRKFSANVLFDEEFGDDPVQGTIGEICEELVARIKKTTTNVDQWRMTFGWEPQHIKTFQECVHHARCLSALGDKDGFVHNILAAADMTAKAKPGNMSSRKTPRTSKEQQNVKKARITHRSGQELTVETTEELHHLITAVHEGHGLIQREVKLKLLNLLPGDLLLKEELKDHEKIENLKDELKTMTPPVSFTFVLNGLTAHDRDLILSAFKRLVDDLTERFKSGQIEAERFESKLTRLCNKVNNLMDYVLVPQSEARNDHSNLALILKTKADYLRYQFCLAPTTLPPDKLPIMGRKISELYEEAHEICKRYLPASHLTTISTACNAAVSQVEIWRNHHGGAMMLREALDEIAEEKNPKKKDHDKKDHKKEEKKEEEGPIKRKLANISEIFTQHLMERNLDTFESSLLLLAIQFEPPAFIAMVEEVEKQFATMNKRPTKRASVLDISGLEGLPDLPLDVPNVDLGFTGRIRQQLCAGLGICSSQEEQPLSSSGAKRPSVVKEEEEQQTSAEEDVVIRWLCTHPLKALAGGESTYFPHGFRWVESAEEWIPDNAPSRQAASGDDGVQHKDHSAKSEWAKVKMTIKAGEGLGISAGQALQVARRNWLVGLVCRHPEGEARPDTREWLHEVAEGIKQQCLAKQEFHRERKAGVIELEAEVQSDLHTLRDNIRPDGCIATEAHVGGCMLFPGDQLMLHEGSMHGQKVLDIESMKLPAKFKFLPGLELATISAREAGPYAEQHHDFLHFYEGSTLKVSPSFQSFARIRRDMRSVHESNLGRGKSNSSPHTVGNLSARRNPLQAISRGAH